MAWQLADGLQSSSLTALHAERQDGYLHHWSPLAAKHSGDPVWTQTICSPSPAPGLAVSSDELLLQIEHQLGNLDRCRRLYERYLAWNPANCQAWCRFADLERSLAETDRARALFELAIQQPLLDMPEVLWKVRVQTWECAA